MNMFDVSLLYDDHIPICQSELRMTGCRDYIRINCCMFSRETVAGL